MKLTADQRKTRDKAFETFEAARDALQEKIDAANSTLTDIFVQLEAAHNEYNDAGKELTDAIHTIGFELSESISEKSDKWQESDAGALAASLAEEYENFEIEQFEFEEFVEVEGPDLDLDDKQGELHDDSSEV